jgi:hypothetical protein
MDADITTTEAYKGPISISHPATAGRLEPQGPTSTYHYPLITLPAHIRAAGL